MSGLVTQIKATQLNFHFFPGNFESLILHADFRSFNPKLKIRGGTRIFGKGGGTCIIFFTSKYSFNSNYNFNFS